MNYILFDSSNRSNLLPLVFTRPVADLLFGILSIREKWETYLGAKTSSLTEGYLQSKFPLVETDQNILINGSVCPTKDLVKEITKLKSGYSLINGESVIAMCLSAHELKLLGDPDSTFECQTIETKLEFVKIENIWDLFNLNERAIKDDFDLLTTGRKSQKISPSNRVINPENIFIEEGAIVEFAILNASKGPIYVGKDAEIMEGAKIRGPFAMREHSVLKMDAKIYGPTTVGPYSKVGGEVTSSVIFGYSNKVHDGFLGHSVIGEWCNIGADTNTSNLKNTYEEVKLWSYPDESFVSTGLQFCGTIMGDHTKCGINTMFNTGTVVGVNVNVYGSGFQRNFIPSFTWGGTQGFADFELKKAFRIAEAVFNRRSKVFGKIDKDILIEIYGLTHNNRRA
jgi:UDP-N-acetylglucosamine diphosphorylase/glucosamine-1-phosphate N-acetyltransferase